MLTDFNGAERVYIACGYTDLRRGIDGLAAQILNRLNGIADFHDVQHAQRIDGKQFNGTICIPQIVAASLGGLILKMFTTEGSIPPEVNMLVLAGVFLIIGACCVGVIKLKK